MQAASCGASLRRWRGPSSYRTAFNRLEGGVNRVSRIVPVETDVRSAGQIKGMEGKINYLKIKWSK